MVKRKQLLEWEDQPEPRPCTAPGCAEPGLYRAPHSRENLADLHWFCLEHIREYNASWNYFAGMDEEDIDRFRAEDIIGHRPTWPLGVGPMSDAANTIADPFRFFARDAEEALNSTQAAKANRMVRPEERRALAKLELAPETTPPELKSRYKELVKRYHPDLNGGDRQGEERLKDVTEAYAFLVSAGYG